MHHHSRRKSVRFLFIFYTRCVHGHLGWQRERSPNPLQLTQVHIALQVHEPSELRGEELPRMLSVLALCCPDQANASAGYRPVGSPRAKPNNAARVMEAPSPEEGLTQRMAHIVGLDEAQFSWRPEVPELELDPPSPYDPPYVPPSPGHAEPYSWRDLFLSTR
jgi:hypothetical protein